MQSTQKSKAQIMTKRRGWGIHPLATCTVSAPWIRVLPQHEGRSQFPVNTRAYTPWQCVQFLPLGYGCYRKMANLTQQIPYNFGIRIAYQQINSLAFHRSTFLLLV